MTRPLLQRPKLNALGRIRIKLGDPAANSSTMELDAHPTADPQVVLVGCVRPELGDEIVKSAIDRRDVRANPNDRR